MIGNKLYNLVKELSSVQLKNLITECKNSNDKRLHLFIKYLEKHDNSLSSLNKFFQKEVKRMWPESSEKENELKIRRLVNYYSIIIEKLILDEYLENNSSIRNILLADVLVRKGNVDLVNYYFDKAYLKSIKEEDLLYQMIGLRGKIRMMYASQNEKKMEEIYLLNNEVLKLLQVNFNNSIAEYYYNISNIFLEKNSIVKDKRDQYIEEIKGYLEKLDDPLQIASLHISLGKLNFNNDQLMEHFIEAKQIMATINDNSKAYRDLKRKLDFLELRLNFFAGKSLEYLKQITDRIFSENDNFSIINNNTIFYKVLFDILEGKHVESLEFLEKNKIYFKGEGKILEQFLKAVIFEKMKEFKKAIQLLQPIIYSSNYFFSIFSRLLVIKIYVDYNYSSVLKSQINSTQRFLTNNKDNPLGMESHLFVLSQLRSRKSTKNTSKFDDNSKLTVFHEYLLE